MQQIFIIFLKLVAQKIKVKFSRIYFYPNDDEEKKEKKKRIVLLSRLCELSFGIIREGCGDKKREDSIRVHWVLLQDPLSRFKAARWKESAPAWMNPSTLVALEIGHRSFSFPSNKDSWNQISRIDFFFLKGELIKSVSWSNFST